LGGLGVAYSGPSFDRQNWNAAFGALYLVNVNMDFFTFGRIKEKVKLPQQVFNRDERDLDQEKFQHQIRVSAAYANCIATEAVVLLKHTKWKLGRLAIVLGLSIRPILIFSLKGKCNRAKVGPVCPGLVWLGVA